MTRWIAVLSVALAAALLVSCEGAKHDEEPAQKPPKRAPVVRPPAPRPQISIGQVIPYTGSNVAYDMIGKVQVAYFAKVNRFGGIRGRDINLTSFDDASSPAVAKEQVAVLVEQVHVSAILSPVGSEVNNALRDYLNAQQIPQLFATSGVSSLDHPQQYPWTIGFRPSYQLEGRSYAEDILRSHPQAKIAVLYRNDDAARQVLAGLKEGLSGKAKIVAQASYEAHASSHEKQLRALRSARADTIVSIGDSEFALATVRELGRQVTHYVAIDEGAARSVAQLAAAEPAQSFITATYYKDPADPRWQNDPGTGEYLAFLESELPYVNPSDPRVLYGYLTSQVLLRVLMDCGDDLSAKNVMAKATALKDFGPGLLLPGITLTTSSTDFQPVDRLQLLHGDGHALALAH